MKYHEIKLEPNEKPVIPMCWKCASKILKEKEPGVLELIGCTECKKIKNYRDAEKYCPLLKKKDKQ